MKFLASLLYIVSLLGGDKTFGHRVTRSGHCVNYRKFVLVLLLFSDDNGNIVLLLVF